MLIRESIEKEGNLDIENGLNIMSDFLGILIRNKKHIEQQYEKEIKIKNLNEQFNHLCNRYKRIHGAQGSLNELIMNQIKKDFKEILK